MNLVGMALSKPILIGAAVVVTVLLGIIAAQGMSIWWLKGALADEREAYAALQGKNARCEQESVALQSSIAAQNNAVAALKHSCEVAGDVATAAIEAAKKTRKEVDKRIADILGGKAAHPEDMCRSACVELRKGVKK